MKEDKGSEKLPFLEKEIKQSKVSSCPKIAEYALCFLVAFPSAALNGLAAVSGNSSKAGDLHTPEDLKNLLNESGIDKIIYGVIALSASEAVLFFLNQRYLLLSITSTVDLLNRTNFTLKSYLFNESIDPQCQAYLYENFLFMWSMFTSLIFAAMGGEALSFFGIAGEIIGFSLSFFVYFSTRFASAKMFIDSLNDSGAKWKETYVEKLSFLKMDKIQIRIPVNHEIDIHQSLRNFLSQVDSEWNSLPKDKTQIMWMQYAAPILGYICIVVTVLPIMSAFIPESIQGIELLTQTEIGKHSHYQNVASFFIGIFSTILTLFFYEISIKELPKHFIFTMLSVYEKILADKIKDASKLLSLTILALASSYLTAIGFKFIADKALENGYLSYLGHSLSKTIPDGLLIAVLAMLWSHLQEIINQVNSDNITDISSLEYVDAKNAKLLLKHPDIDISLLKENRNLIFQQSCEEEGSVKDSIYFSLLPH